MGLECFIRQIPKIQVYRTYTEIREKLSDSSPFKSKIHPDELINKPVGQPLTLVEGYWSVNNEIGYWRGWRGLNNWMFDLAKEKSPEIFDRLEASFCFSGTPILLTSEDIECLRFEVLFGDLWKEYADDFFWNVNPDFIQNQLKKLTNRLDKAQRVIKRNASLVFYVGSW